jgi:hypothetical protein
MQSTTRPMPIIRRSQLNHSFCPSEEAGYEMCGAHNCTLPPSNRRHLRYRGKEPLVIIYDAAIADYEIAVEVDLVRAWLRTPTRFADNLRAHLQLLRASSC